MRTKDVQHMHFVVNDLITLPRKMKQFVQSSFLDTKRILAVMVLVPFEDSIYKKKFSTNGSDAI